MSTSLKLFGLCGIGSFSGSMRAVLPASKADGKEHQPMLSVAAKDCKLSLTKPEFIFFDGSGQQHLGWSIAKKTVKFKGGTGNATFVQGARDQLVDLQPFHNGAEIKLPGSDFAVVELTDGTLSNGPDVQTFTRKFDTTTETKEFGVSVVFTCNLNVLTINGSEVAELRNNAVGAISNLAPVELGHKHFHHYYDEFFKNQPAKKVTIDNAGVQIFDCVPPAPLP